MIFKAISLIAVISFSLSSHVFAQTSTHDIDQYRAMLADDNPAELYVAAGEELWKKHSGPKNTTLEQCDFGLGSGILQGAAAQLPRYFKDSHRVQDLESRIITCMVTLQGFSKSEIIQESFGKGIRKDIEALSAYIASLSRGEKIKVTARHPKEKEMRAIGEKIFFYRSAAMDFSCATCHSENNKRIRLQELANLTEHEDAARVWGTWPAYRVSNGELWTMQHRLNDCYRQQRMPYLIYDSDVSIALSVFMASKANGGVFDAPGLKR